MKYAPILIAFLLLCPAAAAETLSFSFDDWCPYTCMDPATQQPDEAAPGYYVEILRAVFEPLGYDLEFVTRPWERAIEETRQGRLDAVLSPAKSEAPDLIFPAEEIGALAWCFYTKRKHDWEYGGLESLAGETLGVLTGNYFGKELTRYVEDNKGDMKKVQEITGLDFLAKNTNKLIAGRISVMLDEPATTDYFIMVNHLEGMIRKANCVESRNMYVAFSPLRATSEQYALIFTQGMARLRETGALKTILEKYGLTDWREARSETAP